MKKLVKVSMCFLLMLGLSGIQGVQAEGISTYTGDAPSNEEINKEPGFVDDKNKVVEGKHTEDTLREIFLQISKLDQKPIKIKDYEINVEYSDESFFSKQSREQLKIISRTEECGEETAYIVTTDLRPIKEGTVTLDITLTKKSDSDEVYYAKESFTFSDPYKGMNLVATQNEFNTYKDGLIIYENSGVGNDEILKYQEKIFQVGFTNGRGVIENASLDLDVFTTAPSIVNAGFTIKGAMFGDTDLRPYLPNYIGEFSNRDEYNTAIWKHSASRSCGGFGGAGGGAVYSLIPRNAGTAYVTFSYGTQSVTVKVNVSNLSDEPTEKLPSGIADEFYSDANEKVNVTLSNPDTITSDIFKASKETGKDVTFNVLGENNKTKYAWTFNGSTMTNPDMDLDLSLMFDSDKKKEIESLAKDTNLFYLNFAHHGNLPGVANMKVDVSSKYKDGEEIYLYYYNEEKGTVVQTGEKVVVKDGYAEFAISHCSTYFFTTNPIENVGKLEPTAPTTNNTEKKNDSNAIKETAKNEMNSNQGIAVSLLTLVIVGAVVTLKRKYS